MPITLRMPALSPTMEEGVLAKWRIAKGDSVESGAILADIETDKAVMEMEAVDEGVIGKILVEEGASVKVGTPIALLLEEGEEQSALEEEAASGPDQPATAQDQTSAQTKDSGTKEQPPHKEEEPAAAQVREVETYTTSKKQSVRDALRDAIAEEMRRDSRVLLMGEEVAHYQGAYKVSRGLLQEFGEKRVIDTPITEYGFAGLGVGAAFGGLRPIVEFMTWNFAMQAIDHVVNSAAKTRYMSGGQMRCPIVFRGPNAAAARVGAQHSQDFTAWYGSVPGLIVVSPYCSGDAKGLLKSAIRSDNPVVFLEHELLYGESFDVPEEDEHLTPFGVARIRKKGTDVTVVAASRSVGIALQAAKMLSEEEGIEAEILDLRTIRPLDRASVIHSVRKTNRLVTVEESWPQFGVGAEITHSVVRAAFDYLDAPPVRVTQEDTPLPYAENLEKASLPSPEKVVAAIREVMYL